MSWVEWLSPLLSVTPERIRMVLRVAFVVAVVMNADAVAALMQWVGEELARARFENVVETVAG